ncbi:MAG: hypothetical protein AB7O48_07080 [Cyclobacteriaceae bacterium]
MKVTLIKTLSNSDLQNQIEFTPVWGTESNIQRLKAIELWQRNNALSDTEVMEQRAKEVVLMAFRGGQTIAVSTASKRQIKLLNDNFFYEYRCFVDPSARIPALDVRLSRMSFDLLEQWALEHDSTIKGIITILENDNLQREKFWRKAVWPVLNMVFVGYTQGRNPIRVSYFDRARI